MYDLTISAPKTVSVQGIIDPKMHEAHRAAVAEIRRQMELCCGAMVIAKYEHGYSRSLDPQIHTHMVAANLAHDGQKWRTLHANNLYRAQGEINTDYRQRLAEMLDGWGYKIDLRQGVPELTQMPAELKERFSRRTRQLDRAIVERAASRGVKPEEITNREKAILVRVNRPSKEYSEAPDNFAAYQLSRLTDSEHARLEEIVGHALSRSERQEIAVQLTPEPRGEKPSISNSEPYEKPMLRHPWEYGVDSGDTMVSKRPRRVMRMR
jgi:hypothetical protein